MTDHFVYFNSISGRSRKDRESRTIEARIESIGIKIGHRSSGHSKTISSGPLHALTLLSVFFRNMLDVKRSEEGVAQARVI